MVAVLHPAHRAPQKINMQRTKDRQTITAACITAILCIAVFIASLFGTRHDRGEAPKLKSHLDCIIDLGSLPETKRALLVGYNYLFLEEYACSNSQSIDIGIRRSPDQNYLDSLRNGSIDLLVLPQDSSETAPDSILVSRALDSVSVFLMRCDAVADIDSLNSFIASWQKREDYEQVRDSYLKRYNAFRSLKRESISPYDDIIKEHADSLGWDWRALAAIIYQESRFHIEARSHRGASGLMQMMPRTASAFGVDDSLDPEQNICAGARLLDSLLKKYSDIAANPQERFKFALAAYNAGSSRVDDMISLAKYRGVDTGYWDNVAAIIPQMADESVLDTGAVSLGTFHGKETVAYVDSVIAVYERFKIICPEQE